MGGGKVCGGCGEGGGVRRLIGLTVTRKSGLDDNEF